MIITLIVIVGSLFYKNILAYLVASLFFSYLLNPLINKLESFHIHRTISIIIIYLLLTTIIVLIAIFIIPQLIDQIKSMTINFKDFINSDNSTLNFDKIPFISRLMDISETIETKISFINFTEYRGKIFTMMTNVVSNIPTFVMNSLGNIVSLFSFLVAIPIISFFLLKDQTVFKRYLLTLIPNKYFEMVIIILDKVDEILGTYLRALMIEIFIIAILTAIVLSIIGVKYSLLIGLIAGLANAIPYFGPVIAVSFAILSALMSGKAIITIFYVIGGMWLVQIVDNNFIYPIVIGKSIEMHPLIIMLTVIAGGLSFGIFGMFLSVPLIFLIRSLIIVLYKNLKQFEII